MDFLVKIGDFLWAYIGIGLLLGCALFFTIKTGGVQFRMLPEMVRLLVGKYRSREGEGMSSFKAFSVSLASRVGTGNLAGVASAIFIGGPGAVFWMWVTALLGSATGFMEATLAQLYKKRGKDSFYGGPAYYIQTGLGARWMAVIFAITILLNSSVCYQTVQVNTIATSLNETFGWNKVVIAVALAVISFLIVSGGIKRIAEVASYMVPIMSGGYILVALWVIFINIDGLPDAFKLIFQDAFGLRQAGGGMIGVTIMQGVRRGLFSNEAGEGTAPNAAAIARTSHPVKQGLIQALGVFIDTLVICTCTALIIILSGLYDCGDDGIVLTIRALESEIGPVGKYFITIAVFLFAFSTVIANYYYGETNIRFIKDNRVLVWALRILTPVIVFVGSMMELQTAWNCVDISMALLTICNLFAILMLSGQVFRLLKDYVNQKKAGIKSPQFRRSSMPDISDKLEGWPD